MEDELSNQIHNLSNSKKIRFAKLLKTFKGGANSSLQVIKENTNTTSEEKPKRGLKQLLGGFINSRIEGLKDLVTPNFLKGEKVKEEPIIQKAGSSNEVANLTDAINNLNQLLSSNPTLTGGGGEEKPPPPNEKKPPKKKKQPKKKNKKSVKKSAKPKKKTYKNKKKK